MMNLHIKIFFFIELAFHLKRFRTSIKSNNDITKEMKFHQLRYESFISIEQKIPETFSSTLEIKKLGQQNNQTS